MEDLCVSNVVMLTSADKADVRICNDPTSRTLERKIPLEKVVEFVLKNLGVNEISTPNNYSRCDSKCPGTDTDWHHLYHTEPSYFISYESEFMESE